MDFLLHRGQCPEYHIVLGSTVRNVGFKKTLSILFNTIILGYYQHSLKSSGMQFVTKEIGTHFMEEMSELCAEKEG